MLPVSHGRLLAVFGGGAIAALAPQAVLAQQIFTGGQNVSVVERPRPAFEAQGVHLGTLTAFPRVIFGAEYNDNVLAEAKPDADSDHALSISPSMSLVSGWSRHRLEGYVRLSDNRFDKLTSDSATTWGGGLVGTLDLSNNYKVSGTTLVNRYIEERYAPNAATSAVKPITVNESGFGGSVEKNGSRIRVLASAEVRNYDYRDGVNALGAVIDQDQRDRKVYTLALRSDYALSPDRALYATISRNVRDYELPPTVGDTNRNSSGYTAALGFRFDLSRLTRGEFEIGAFEQSFDEGGVANESGLAYKGKIEWFMTQLMTVTFEGSRAVEDAAVFGATGYVRSNVGARLDYEILRNVILSASAKFDKNEFSGLDRADDRREFGASADWLVNRRVAIGAQISSLRQTSDGIDKGLDYSINRVAVRLRVHL